MTLASDTTKMLHFIDSAKITVSPRGGEPAWTHMGALLADAALQPRRKYSSWVVPKVVSLRDAWPDAATTKGLLVRLESDDLAEALGGVDAPRRITKIGALAAVLDRARIQDVLELRSHLAAPETRPQTREALRQVRDVGPKTVDYFDRLVGLPDGVAIDSRLRAVARTAGIENTSYDHLAAVIRTVAGERGWEAADLDAALWSFGQ